MKKNIILIISCTIFTISKMADIFSTLSAGIESEENEIVRYIWNSFGNYGLIAFLAIAIIISILIVLITARIIPKSKLIISISLIIFSTFNFLIAMANMGSLTAYSITSYLIGK